MKKYVLNVKNLSKLYIYTDMEKICKKLSVQRNVSKTIPAVSQFIGDTNQIGETNNYILLLNNNINSINIDKENNIANIFANEKNFFFPDLVYLAIGMIANDLQKKDMYFVQSSVVKYDDTHSIMLLGDPNSGKTSMAYSLMKNYGYSLISNDNVLINSNKTICGTKDVQMRYGAIKLFFPEILPYIDVPKEDEGRNEWDIKIYINDYLDSQGFGTSDDSIITDIYNIKTYKHGDTFIKKREYIDEILLMYEHITKQIRSNRYAIVSMNYPLPSFEKEEYMQNRYDIAVDMTNNVEIYDAQGTIKSLTRSIGKKYER